MKYPCARPNYCPSTFLHLHVQIKLCNRFQHTSAASQQPQHITVRQQPPSGVATIAGVSGQQVLLVQQPPTRATVQAVPGSIVQIQPQTASGHSGAQTMVAHASNAHPAQHQRPEHTGGFHTPLNGAPPTTLVVQQTVPQPPQMQRAYVQGPVPTANVYIGSQRYHATLLGERSRDPNALPPKQEYRELKRKFKFLVYVRGTWWTSLASVIYRKTNATKRSCVIFRGSS